MVLQRRVWLESQIFIGESDAGQDVVDSAA